MNPKLVKQFKDTLNKSKTDKLDCFKQMCNFFDRISV